MLSIGDPAPVFTLPDTEGNPLSLTDLKGSKRLVVFIPFPFTGNCTDEGCALRDNLAQFGDLDAEVVVITCDTRHANRRWSEENGFTFPVLSDFWPHGNTARAYGAFNEQTGSANRVSYVIDPGGAVRDIIASGSLGVVRDFDAHIEALQKL
jgi:peroxiredoxin